jgi:hypothetical protein
MWLKALRPYYKDEMLRLCPSATKRFTEGGQAPFAAWTFALMDGSYGINGFIYSPAPETNTLWGHPVKWCWRNINQGGGNNIPMFLDANVLNGGPLETDEPPQHESEIGADWYNHIRRFFANRHEGRQNGVFLDCSVRRIGCKELWTLKWHREYDINGPWTMAGGVTPSDWPDWMRNLKDY